MFKILPALLAVAFSIHQTHSQVLQVTSFEIEVENKEELLRERTEDWQALLKMFEQLINNRLGTVDVGYAESVDIAQPEYQIVSSDPLTSQESIDYSATLSFRFVLGSTSSNTKYDVQNLRFKSAIMINNANGEEIFKNKSSLKTRIDPFCSSLTDRWMNVEDLLWLMDESMTELLTEDTRKRERKTLTCCRSEELAAQLSQMDSIFIERRKKNFIVLHNGRAIQEIKVTAGSTNKEFTEEFFGWNVSDRMKQKKTIEDLTSGRRFEAVVSISANENYDDHDGVGDADDASVTFYDKEHPFAQFSMLGYDRLKGFWEKDTLDIRERDEYLQFRINHQEQALSKDLVIKRGKKKSEVAVIHFLPNADATFIRMLMYSHLAYNWAYDLEMQALQDEMDDDDE